MTPYERQREILSILKDGQFKSVHFLAKKLFSSEPTIRRDLTILKKNREVERVSGGAIISGDKYRERPIMLSNKENHDQKHIIAQLAIKLVKKNHRIFLDSSSTCFLLAKEMTKFNNLTVVTNGLLTAHLLSEESDSVIHCTGGRVYSNRSSVNGHYANCFIQGHYADITFISCKGLDVNFGISDLTEEEAAVKKMYYANSKETILLVDSSKFNKVYFSKAVDWSQISTIISNEKLPLNLLQKSLDYQIKVIYPE